MVMNRLLQSTSFRFGPREVERMATAYEHAVHELGIGPFDPAAETVAREIVQVVKAGEEDPLRVAEQAMSNLSDQTASDE